MVVGVKELVKKQREGEVMKISYWSFFMILFLSIFQLRAMQLGRNKLISVATVLAEHNKRHEELINSFTIIKAKIAALAERVQLESKILLGEALVRVQEYRRKANERAVREERSALLASIGNSCGISYDTDYLEDDNYGKELDIIFQQYGFDEDSKQYLCQLAYESARSKDDELCLVGIRLYDMLIQQGLINAHERLVATSDLTKTIESALRVISLKQEALCLQGLRLLISVIDHGCTACKTRVKEAVTLLKAHDNKEIRELAEKLLSM